MNPIIIIIILGIAGLFIYFKTTGAKFGKTWTYLIGGLILFVILTFGFVITRPGVDISTLDGGIEALRTYFLWLGGTFDKATSISGNIVNTDWGVNKTSIK